MKQFLLLCVVALAGMGSVAAQQNIYVDANRDTTGVDTDGTSFATAYNSLKQAIMVADSGAVLFLADGTYRTDENGPFFINKGITISGGYDGTDDFAEADPAANLTILSGDVLGNDTGTLTDLGDSTMTDDNTRVLIIQDTSSTESAFTVFIDGVTIANGRAPRLNEFVDSVTNAALISGGGIWTTAQVGVTRVTFVDNQATAASPDILGRGACMYMAGNAGGSLLNNVTMERSVPTQGGYFYLRQTSDVTVANSNFSLDEVDDSQSPIFDVFNSFRLRFLRDTFFDISGTAEGAAMFLNNGFFTQVAGCQFRDISAGAAGAIYTQVNAGIFADRPSNPNELFILDSEFTNLSTPNGTIRSRGGAIWNTGTSVNVRRSTFDNCSSSFIGGGVYYQLGDLTSAIVAEYDSCTFSNNSAGQGGALYIFPDGITTNVRNSTFTGNQATGTGASIYYQSLTGTDANEGALTVINSRFEENGGDQGPTRGSAIFATIQDSIVSPTDSTVMTIGSVLLDSCTIVNNTTIADDGALAGGAVSFEGRSFSRPGRPNGNSQPRLTIRNTEFSGNNSQGGAGLPGGGAITVFHGHYLDIQNSRFLNNTSDNGGAIMAFRFPRRLVDADANGRLFFVGFTTPTGELVDSLNDTDRFYPPSDMVIDQTSFQGNVAGSQGGAIILFTGESTNIQNSIFANNLLAVDGGSGGAILINGPDDGVRMPVTTMVNNTFFGNTDGGRDQPSGSSPPSRGNSLAVFLQGSTNPDSVNYTVQLQNNAFFTNSIDDESIGIERNVAANDPDGFGDIRLVSLGGNYFSSENEPDAASVFEADDMGRDSFQLEDVDVELEDIFVDAEADNSDFPDFSLVFDPENPDLNPLINNGVTGPLVPSYDFFGNPRGERPDIGAIEIDPELVSTKPQSADGSGLQMEFFPNPTADFLNIVNNEAASVDVVVADMNGRVLGMRTFRGTTNQVDLTQLPAGVYNLLLTVDGSVYVKQVVKQ